MGKGSDLWDDSALLNAFNDAMTTYKVMHSKTHHGDSSKEEEHTDRNSEHESLLTGKTNGPVELEVCDANISNNGTETNTPNSEAAFKDLPVEANTLSTDSHASEAHIQPSGFPSIGENAESYSDLQTVHYNELVRRYYELEEQKQKVIQQLQAGYGNYQSHVKSTTYQDHQAPANDASEHSLQPACCMTTPLAPTCATGGPLLGGYCCCSACTACCSASLVEQCPCGNCYYYPCPLSSFTGESSFALNVNISPCLPSHAPSHSVGPTESGTCSVATSCMMNTFKQCTPADDSVFKMGMMAAERVISSMQKELSAISSNGEEKVEGKDKEEGSGIHSGNGSQRICSDTNLPAVLGAWYAAGFHTGRYLVEQSKRNPS